MKAPKQIYAKVEVRNGEEVLRLSTSPFLKGNIIYKLSKDEPLDEEKLDKLAKKYADTYAIPNTFQHTTMEAAYKNGYKQAWEDKQ